MAQMIKVAILNQNRPVAVYPIEKDAAVKAWKGYPTLEYPELGVRLIEGGKVKEEGAIASRWAWKMIE